MEREMQCCGNCYFHREMKCHRNAPSISLGLAQWATTVDHEWCGEWVDKDEQFSWGMADAAKRKRDS